VFAYLRAPLKDAPLQQASASAWLEVAPRLGPSYARVILTGDAFAASVVSEPPVRGLVREGYVGIGDERVDLRIGQQIIPWGNADVVNPTDLLTARDYTFFSADPEANRLGVLSARASWTPLEWLGLVAVWTPVAPVSTLLIPPGLVPSNVTVLAGQRPDASLANSEVAGRVTVNGNGWDVSLIGFRGWNHTPEFELRQIEPSGVIDIGTVQHRYVAAGGDASVTIGRVVLRAESAYVVTDNPDGTNPLIQPTHWDTTAGIESSFFQEHLRVQLQGIARVHPQYTAPADARGPDPATTAADVAIARSNSILLNYTSRYRIASSARVAYATSDDKFGAEVFAIVDLEGVHDYFVRPLLTYRPTDALKFELGVDLYGGPNDSPLGALSTFNGAFLQATYQF
jgi:hypothetical protein